MKWEFMFLEKSHYPQSVKAFSEVRQKESCRGVTMGKKKLIDKILHLMLLHQPIKLLQ